MIIKKKSKDNPTHDTNLTITARSVVYDNTDVLGQQVAWVKHQFPTTFGLFKGIPPKYTFKIFDHLPNTPDEATFGSSLLLEATGTQLTALVFYAPDLNCLGSFNNSNSKSSSTYTISTTSGFTFSMSQKIGASVKISAGVIFEKAEVSFNFELSFTEQWNTSQTETIAFQIPGGVSSFLYKGKLATKYIYFDPTNYQYTYGPDGSFNTNYVVSSEKPLNGDPIYPS